jgi:hypothetical protein
MGERCTFASSRVVGIYRIVVIGSILWTVSRCREVRPHSLDRLTKRSCFSRFNAMIVKDRYGSQEYRVGEAHLARK